MQLVFFPLHPVLLLGELELFSGCYQGTIAGGTYACYTCTYALICMQGALYRTYIQHVHAYMHFWYVRKVHSCLVTWETHNQNTSVDAEALLGASLRKLASVVLRFLRSTEHECSNAKESEDA